MKTLILVASSVACLCGTALAQDAKPVIASAQRALGDLTSITYSGSAKDVAFQQCGANAAAMMCQGTHDPSGDQNTSGSGSGRARITHTGATNNRGGG